MREANSASLVTSITSAPTAWPDGAAHTGATTARSVVKASCMFSNALRSGAASSARAGRVEQQVELGRARAHLLHADDGRQARQAMDNLLQRQQRPVGALLLHFDDQLLDAAAALPEAGDEAAPCLAQRRFRILLGHLGPGRRRVHTYVTSIGAKLPPTMAGTFSTDAAG